MKYFGYFLAIITLIIAVFLCAPKPASAQELTGDDEMALLTEKSPDWKIHTGAFQGVSIDGKSYTTADILIDNPTGDLPVFFEFFPTRAWYRVIQIDDTTLNMARFDYEIADSNTFFGAVYQDERDTAIGIRYAGNHWNLPYLDSIDFTAMIREGGRYLILSDADYEFTAGYGIEAHGYLYLMEDGSREKLDGEILAWHNMIPDGTIKLKAGYVNWLDKDMIVFGVWGVF